MPSLAIPNTVTRPPVIDGFNSISKIPSSYYLSDNTIAPVIDFSQDNTAGVAYLTHKILRINIYPIY
jgi:hypothetical protein